MSNSILEQIKARRLQLELKQQDMYMRVGISRQQYQRLESQGNPRLDTLELVAQGLSSELMLIPKDKREEVARLLSGYDDKVSHDSEATQTLVDDPWRGLLDE
jgi:transcriptional regulator with XRE-family HTH domain